MSLPDETPIYLENYAQEEVFLEKNIFNLLISVLLTKSGLSLSDINDFILSQYDELSNTNIPIKIKTDIDTTELFTTLFGNNTKLKLDEFNIIFIHWYQNIYNTHIGNVMKAVMLAYVNDEIIKILLSIINEFEVFVDHKKHEDRVTILEPLTTGALTTGGGRIDFIKVILLLVSCLVVFAPSGNFIEKTEVQKLVNQKISSVSSQFQISDTILTNTAVNLLKDNLFKDIKSTTGVEIVDYLDYWKIDDKYITDCVKNTKNVLQTFSGITEMVSEYIIDTNNGKNGEGLLSNFLMPSFFSVFDMESMIQLKDSIQKSTQDINKMITIFTTITNTIEQFKLVANPKIKGSVEIFLRLLEPKITERYDLQNKITGGKHKKLLRRKKRTFKKRQNIKKFTTTRKRVKNNK